MGRRRRGDLEALLGIYVEERGLGRVLGAPFQMRLAEPVRSSREPDLLFVARERLDCLRDTYLDGPADLVVEIVSPESRLRDRGEKFAEYELSGVREYWLLDPSAERRISTAWTPAGATAWWSRMGRAGYESVAVPGFRLRPEWLWQVPTPRVLEVVRELGLLP